MRSRYTIGEERTFTVYKGKREFSVTLKLTVPPVPAAGPTYSHGGLPPEPPEFDLVKIEPADISDEEQEEIFDAAYALALETSWEMEVEFERDPDT